MCEHILTREKEKRTGETVERLTNQAQEKQFERDLARQHRDLYVPQRLPHWGNFLYTLG